MLEILIFGGLVYYLYSKSNNTNPNTHSKGLAPKTINEIINNVNTINNVNINKSSFDINNENKLKEVLPELAIKINQVLLLAKQNGYQLYIDEAYRTQARQNELYAQGRTKAGNIVTNTLTSKHTQKKAVDLMPVINGKPTNDIKSFNWQLIGIWARQVGGLTWGGNWTLRDYRHLEI